MKKKTVTSIMAAMLLAASISGTAVVQAAPHDTSIAIITESMPTENSDQEGNNADGAGFKSRVAEILNQDAGTVKGVKRGDLYVPKDTQIMLVLQDPLHSKRVKSGANFRLKTADNLMINDVIVIPKGQEVIGRVLKAHGNGLFGSSGKLEINIPYVETRNGIQIPVNGYVSGYGKSDGGAIAVAAAVTFIGGLFMKGTNIEYTPGQLFCVTVKEDTDLDATPDNLEAAMASTRPHGQNLVVKAAQ